MCIIRCDENKEEEEEKNVQWKMRGKRTEVFEFLTCVKDTEKGFGKVSRLILPFNVKKFEL